MKLTTFGVFAAMGMTATCVAVWHVTSPARASAPSASDADVIAAGASPRIPPSPVTPEPLAPIAQPSFQAGQTLTMEGRLGHAVIPAVTDTETYLFVDVRAMRADARPNRRADLTAGRTAARLDIAIAIDRSGSMRGKRLRDALAAARAMIERLRDGDTVSVVTYNTRTEIALAPTVIDARTRSRALASLRRIRASGDTCISCGIEAGLRLVGRDPGAVSRVLLLSDGKATAGVRDVEGFRQIADRSRARGVAISSIGLEADYNERIMATVARASNGGHYFAASTAELPGIFDREMDSLDSSIAADAEVIVELGPGVLLDRVFDRAFHRSAGRIAIPLGTFAESDVKTVLLRLRVPRGGAGARAIASVRLAYTDLTTGERDGADGRLIAEATLDPRRVSRLDGLVSARLSRSETAALLEQTNDLIRSGRGREAQQLLRRKREELHERNKDALTLTPADRSASLDADFAKQGKALAAASSALAPVAETATAAEADLAAEPAADPAPRPDAPKAAARAPAKRTKVQMRDNQRAAFDLGL